MQQVETGIYLCFHTLLCKRMKRIKMMLYLQLKDHTQGSLGTPRDGRYLTNIAANGITGPDEVQLVGLEPTTKAFRVPCSAVEL